MNSEELRAWLDQARRLFGEVFAQQAGVCLRITIANAMKKDQSVSYRLPDLEPATDRVITVAPGVEIHVNADVQGRPIGSAAAEGLPVLRVVELSADERAVLQACLNSRLIGKQLCRAVRKPYTSTTRSIFSRLIYDKKCLERNGEGYLTTDLGRLSLGLHTGEATGPPVAEDTDQDDDADLARRIVEARERERAEEQAA